MYIKYVRMYVCMNEWIYVEMDGKFHQSSQQSIYMECNIIIIIYSF